MIMIIVPIVRDGKARTDPPYLLALDSSVDNQGPFSLEDCLPLNNYITYTTCLAGYSSEASSVNAITYVNTTGLSVSPELMNTIKSKCLGGLAYLALSDAFMVKFPMTRVTMNDVTTMSKYVSVAASPFTNYVPPSNAPPTTDNYKCMPLDMAQIQTSDLSGAKTLTQVLLPTVKDQKLLDPGLTEKVLTIILGVALVLLVFVVGFLTVFNVVVPAAGAAAGVTPAAGAAAVASATTSTQTLTVMMPYILAAGIGLVAGSLITFFMNNRTIGK